MVSVEQSHLDIVHATGREVDVSEVPQVKNDIEVDLGGHGGSEQVGDGLELMGDGGTRTESTASGRSSSYSGGQAIHQKEFPPKLKSPENLMNTLTHG